MMRLGIDADGVFQEKPGELAPGEGVDVKRFTEAREWLSRRNFLSTARYRALKWKADREGALPEVLEWYDRALARFNALGIPAHAAQIKITDAHQASQWVMGKTDERQSPFTEGRAVELVHSIRGRDLPGVAWEVFRAVGEEAASDLGIPMRWGGPEKPWLWVFEGTEGDLAGEDRRNLSRSPPGEREGLERHYGLRRE